MSEEFSTADLERLKLRDTRFAILSAAIDVENDLRSSPVIRALMEAVRADADQAMKDISETSPADVQSISLLLVKIRTLVYVRSVLDTILHRGQVAEAAIRAEDEREGGA